MLPARSDATDRLSGWGAYLQTTRDGVAWCYALAADAKTGAVQLPFLRFVALNV